MINLIIGAVIGFVVGALVYRNNKEKADKIIDKIEK